jgi:NAD(P)-dependent dehydrogenase (short-subunit alcohol dehydrogenase family)
MPNLAGKVALVTGCGKTEGIGWATALRLAHDGADVAIHGRPNVEDATKELGRTIAGFGRRALRVTGDLANEKEVVRLVDTAFEHFGRIDILVNNAAIAGPLKVPGAIKDSDWNDALAVNLRGAFNCAREVARIMAGQRSGVINNVVSGAATHTPPEAMVYSATKAALASLTQSLATEFATKGIRVNAVAPGDVASPLGTAIQQAAEKRAQAAGLGRSAEGRSATVEDVASAIGFLASDDALRISGQVLAVG